MVDSCEIRIWEHPDYTGQRWKSFNSSKSQGDSWINDRDSSAKTYGNCKNTSYLVYEHPNYTGYAYILGEGDNIPNLHDGNSHGKGKGGGGRDHRWHKRGDRMNAVERINIPTQNKNEGRMRQDITIYGKRVDTRPHQWGHFPAITKASDAGDSDQWITDENNKGKACPGGDAYWKGFQKVSCVYNVKTGSGLGRIRTLHSEIKNSSIPNDPRKDMFDNIASDYCDRADRLDDKITSGSGSDSTCRGFANVKDQARDYCKNGDKIKTDTMLCTNESDSLGPTLYDELASKYCDANPNDPFCECYNVVTNKCKGEEIDKEIKKLEAGRKPIKGVSSIWYGFDNKTEYLNIGQIEVYSGGKNIVKDIPGVYVTVNSEYGDGTNYRKNQLFDGNYISMYHSAGKPNDWIKIDLGKEYTIDEVKVFNRHSCGSCNERWAGSYVKLLDSSGNLIKASERVVGDHKEGGVRVKTFFDNGVSAAKAKLTIPGCKITVPIRRTLTDLPRKYSAALDGADKCWGNVCTSKGGKTFVPKNAIVAGDICSKSMTICNVDLRAGNLQDSEINIEQKCGEQEGTPAPMSPPSSNEPSEPSDGSTDGTPAPMGSSSTPLKSSSSKDDDDGDEDEKELKIYEKPSVQIGTVASSLVSISSCAMLIMLAM
tara:strand:- start:84 stop:2045 length:1962 start_codon:yes stop_codon:yes gene_type:complete